MKKQLLIFIASLIFVACLAPTVAAQQRPSNDDVLKPVAVKTDLYPADADAKKEIDEALKIAAAEKRRKIRCDVSVLSTARNCPFEENMNLTIGPGIAKSSVEPSRERSVRRPVASSPC